MTSDEFRALCRAHDLTFEYSDDSSAYNKGSAELLAIKKAAEYLPPGEGARIWNEVAKTKILPAYVEPYLWPEQP